MQPFGSDRVRLDGERIVLSSRLDKGWTPRVDKTLIRAEFPGTAVLWDNEYFEVVTADSLPQGGVRYVLEAWREHNAMRVTSRYDAESEAERLDEYRKSLLREKKRKTANALALLTGHLPAIVQITMAEELGLMASRITFVSILGMYALLVACILYIISGIINETPRAIVFEIAVLALIVENTIRFMVNWTQNRPIGSSIGFLVYLVYWPFGGNVSPFAEEKGLATPISEPTAERAAQDMLHMREAFVTLLPAADQKRIEARFGYDHRRLSRGVAIVLLVFSALGVATSIHSGARVSLIAALAIAIEQVMRLSVIPRRPAGSILGLLIRPMLRKLL
jgi:hypothetical protein